MDSGLDQRRREADAGRIEGAAKAVQEVARALNREGRRGKALWLSADVLESIARAVRGGFLDRRGLIYRHAMDLVVEIEKEGFPNTREAKSPPRSP